jgi:hypothetical protein
MEASMKRLFKLSLLGCLSCGGTDVSEFTYGGGQPGAALKEGGEIRHENVRMLGMPIQTWVHVYQYTGDPDSAPLPGPGTGGIFGDCIDERTSPPTWPLTPITGATYLDLPKVELSGPGIDGVLDIVRTDPPNMVGNSSFRQHDFTYGGGAPGNPPMGFNGTLVAEQSTPGGEYTLDIGKGEPMNYFMPEPYDAPLGIGTQMMVTIPAGQDLVMTWTPPDQDFGDSGTEHTKKTHFNATFFADPTAASPPLFLCPSGSEGNQTIPKAVIDALPASGLVVQFNLTHWMEAREAASGEQRRFDLVAIFCNISLFQKQ